MSCLNWFPHVWSQWFHYLRLGSWLVASVTRRGLLGLVVEHLPDISAMTKRFHSTRLETRTPARDRVLRAPTHSNIPCISHGLEPLPRLSWLIVHILVSKSCQRASNLKPRLPKLARRTSGHPQRRILGYTSRMENNYILLLPVPLWEHPSKDFNVKKWRDRAK